MDSHDLFGLWVQFKEAEAAAVEQRRAIEDQLVLHLHVDVANAGTVTAEGGGFKVKIATRHDKKIDPDLLQELAEENNLSDFLPELFRWKPEINAKAWLSAPDSVKSVLGLAMTIKPSRPSFSITSIEGE